MNIKNKIVLITGGTSGIGYATSREFLTLGAKVFIVGRDLDKGKKALKTLLKSGKVEFVKCDVTDEPQVADLISYIVKKYKRLDIAFNNAGVTGKMGNLSELTSEDYDNYLNGNLKSVWLSMKYELTQMEKQGFGVIVNNISVKGITGAKKYSLYSAAKHGVIGLTKSAAIEYGSKKIRINGIATLGISTGLMKTVLRNIFPDMAFEESLKKYGGVLPMGRPGKLEEIAKSVVWLCSEDSSFITGHILHVDGGSLAQGLP